jgi:tetratricopeptide (TPR) repeat protein
MLFRRAEPPTISVNAISVTLQSEDWMFNLGIPLLGIMLIIIGLGAAADVPFVFDSSSSGVAGYSADQLESMRASSPELSGVPSVSTPSDNEVIAFPVTGGGNAPISTTMQKVRELKRTFDERVDMNNSDVLNQGAMLAAKYPGDLTADQISSIYDYLKNGDGTKRGWSYVRDRRGLDYFRYANESLKLGERTDCSGVGDCDDFAILMAALVESVGGTTRIILARNNTTGGHAYTEVYLGQLDAQNTQVEAIIDWLKEKFDTGKIYTHIDTDTKDVWLNLDWGPDEKGITHPGGPFYPGDKHIVLSIRDKFVKTPLKLPESPKKEIKPGEIAQKEGVGVNFNKTALERSQETPQLVRAFGVSGKDSETSIQQTVETGSAADWLEKGIGFYNLNRYDEAIQAYNRALELNPQDPMAWRNKGYALNKLGKNREANECFWKATGLSAGYSSDRGHLVNESQFYARILSGER